MINPLREAIARIVDPEAMDDSNLSVGLFTTRYEQALTKADAIIALIATQAAQLQACREALEPFAGFGIFLSGPDDYVAYQFYDLKLTTGDFRRARSVLHPAQGEDGK